MGEFSFTCCVSGLPIEGGDKVRYFLLTQNPFQDESTHPCYVYGFWSPRTVPLRGEYNCYGSVEKEESGPQKDVWLELFNRDAVEVGTGDNSYHDVPFRKPVTWDMLREALWEGRVCVLPEEREEEDREKMPKGVPTIQRVEALLRRHDFVVSDQGYMVDELEEGLLRIRWREGNGAKALAKILPVLTAHYAAMLTAGSGSYGFSAEVWVRPKPGDSRQMIGRRWKPQPIPVRQAMIREDVWQAIKGLHPPETKSLEWWKDHLQKTMEEEKECRATWEGKDVLPPTRSGRTLADMMSPFGSRSSLWSDGPRLVVGPGAHFLALAKKGDVPQAFLDTWVEFRHLEQVLSVGGYQWRPTGLGGPQFPEWQTQAQIAKVFFEVAKGKAKEQKEERRKYREEEDE